MPQGKHKPGYRRPRTGEKRTVRQPFKFESLPEEARRFVEDARQWRCRCEKRLPHRHGWEVLPALLQKTYGVKISRSALHAGYDVLVEQARAEILKQTESVKQLVAAFERIGFKNLPAATLNALAGEAFAAMHSASPEEKQKSLGNLLFLQARLMQGQAARDRAALEQKKVALSEKKFAQAEKTLKSETDRITGRMKKGKLPTKADIERIAERTFGKAPKK